MLNYVCTCRLTRLCELAMATATATRLAPPAILNNCVCNNTLHTQARHQIRQNSFKVTLFSKWRFSAAYTSRPEADVIYY